MAKILVVEDSEEIRVVLCHAIEFAGHAPHCAATFAEGKSAIETREFPLIVTDVRLPDGSGRVLADAARRAGMHVVLISGHPEEVEAMAAEREVTVLGKPFRLEQLAAAIEDHLGAAASDR
jgi:DNA-binding NtrC family response regulator